MNAYLRWLSSKTESVYWHDSAIPAELEAAIEDGARGMTTNPFLVFSTLNALPEYWKPMLNGICDGAKGSEKAEALMERVTKSFANRLAMYRPEGDWKGFCCVQTDPSKPGDVETMVREAERYASVAPNFVIKMPATRAGIEALETCAAKGMNVAATVSFTVPQVLAVGEAISRGKKKALENGVKPGLGIAVLMVGRLDDYLRDVMEDTRAKATPDDIRWAGIAAIKRAYKIFEKEGYDCVLMPAGCRGAYHITELAGAKMIMSIAPKIAKQLEGVDEASFVPKSDEPVDAAIIDRLMSMPEFRKAYEPDGMTQDEFITFGSCNRTLDQFVNCGWNPLCSYKTIK